MGLLKKSVAPFEISALSVPKFFAKQRELDGLKGHEVIILAARKHGPARRSIEVRCLWVLY